jgi:outer membrane protein OmpA-like peptidoglycan-associated protein
VSDPKKFPSLPPNDFDKTTPNIKLPENIESSDWEKTNYNVKFSPQPPADDWGKTQANIPPVNPEPDFNKTYMPSPKTPEWGMTEANIRISPEDFGGNQEARTDFAATAPFIQLPEAERAKYQNLPPTPTQAAEQKREEEKKKGGVPTWFWVTAGLLSLFFVAIAAILLVYWIYGQPQGFQIVIESPPPTGDVWVDNQAQWGVRQSNGTILLKGLRPGTRKLEIRGAEGYKCPTREVPGNDGDIKTITAGCEKTGATVGPAKTPAGAGCDVMPRLGEFDKAERCANAELDALPPAPNYSADDVVRALNIFIINFDKNKYNIPSERMKFIERAAGFIRNLPESTVIEVGGHTDDRNTFEYNKKLSMNRADAVRNALIGFGVRPAALVAKGYGFENPRVNNDTEENRFYNRRIEYKVIRR